MGPSKEILDKNWQGMDTAVDRKWNSVCPDEVQRKQRIAREEAVENTGIGTRTHHMEIKMQESDPKGKYTLHDPGSK